MKASEHIDAAIEALRSAREHLKAAECPNTLARVRGAIDSAEGAQRNQRTRDLDTTHGLSRRKIKTAKRRNLHPNEMATLCDPHADAQKQARADAALERYLARTYTSDGGDRDERLRTTD